MSIDVGKTILDHEKRLSRLEGYIRLLIVLSGTNTTILIAIWLKLLGL